MNTVSRAVSLAFVVAAALTSADEPDQDARIFRRVEHFIVANRRVNLTLDAKPIPMVDWTLVQAGFIEYVDKRDGKVVPLKAKHDLQSPEQVRAVPFAVPVALQLRTMPARLDSSLTEEFSPTDPRFPWQRKKRVHMLVYDDADGLYKLWYETEAGIAFATSPDLKQWHLPLKPHRKRDGQETNLLSVLNAEDAAKNGMLASSGEAQPGASGAFFADPAAPADQRYKCTFLAHLKKNNYDYAKETAEPVSAMTGPGSTVLWGGVSADGVGWRILLRPIMLHDADTMTVAKWDPNINQYVMYTRLWEFGRRAVGRSQTADFHRWPLPDNVLSPGPQQAPTEDYYATASSFYPGVPQLRMIFLLDYQGQYDGSDIRLSMSRDGRQFHLVPGEPLVARGAPGTPEAGFLSPVPSFVRAPDGRMLLFCNCYPQPHKFPRYRFGSTQQKLAWWPADRLVALEAAGHGEFTTPVLKLDGDALVLNLSTSPAGRIQVELRDEKFNPIAGHAFADADPLVGDSTAMKVTWRGNGNLVPLRGQQIYLRFRMQAARLFALAAPGRDPTIEACIAK
jgi:hypothetical protein